MFLRSNSARFLFADPCSCNNFLDGGFEHNGKCYAIEREKKVYLDAVTYCVTNGGLIAGPIDMDWITKVDNLGILAEVR